MENKNDILVDEACDCADDLLTLSIDDASDDAIDELWDEVDEDDIEVCASDKRCSKKKWIIAAVAVCVIVAIVTIIVCKSSKKSKEN